MILPSPNRLTTVCGKPASVCYPRATERIISHLQKTIDYQPVIGIMGKTGSGKSSLQCAVSAACLPDS